MLEEMGYEKIASVAEVGLQTRYRDEFPITNELIYLNHAAVAPVCRRAAEAMKQLVDDVCRHGSLHYDRWLEAYEGLRRAAARLINASPGEIAIVKNTSEGIAMVAQGLGWKPGDRVIAFREEFPANYYPWARLEKRGVQLNWLSIYDPLEKIADAASGARLLAVSFVNYLSGLRMDLAAIGELCRRRGCFFFVDAIQGMGAFPIDVEACHIDGLAADGHKWMLGPEGNGLLYVRRKWLEAIEPVEFGYTNTAKYTDYGTRDMTLRSDAARYECGTLNTAGCFGLRAAIEFLLEVGIENIARELLALTDQLAAGLRRKRYELMREPTPRTGSGIISFRHPAVDCRSIVSELKRKSILAAPRQGWVRMAPHFYVSPEEIEQVLRALPDV
jgi:cysteine desulfurase / selenocysteine lyase